MDSTTSADPAPSAREARIAGLCYLFVIAGGVFAALFVRESLFVSGNAAATVRAIADNESLWRWGIAVHALYLIAAAAFGVILYRFFKAMHPTLALLALVFAVVPVAIEALLLTGLYVPLTMIGERAVFNGIDEGQRNAIGYLGVRLFLTGWGFSLLLFSGFCALTGILILRTVLIPRVIGVLMIAAGAAYFVNSLAVILAPGLATALQPGILVPAFVGELSLALWLTIKGVKTSDRPIA